jgi:DNA-binding transcriptional LysR family regulator
MLHAKMLFYLDEVARCGSIRKAAIKFNIASTAINRQIIALEQELGAPIFERMPRRLRLTASGEVLIEHVRETLKNYVRTTQRLDALKGTNSGQVSISTTLGLTAGPMARIVHDFIEQHPRVQVRMRGLFAEGILNSILAGEAAMGLGFDLQPTPGLKTLFKFDIPFGAVVSSTHPLVQLSHVRFADVALYPLVLAESSMTLRTSIDLALSRLPAVPRAVIETNSMTMMKQFVQLGQAVTFLNPLDLCNELPAGPLRYLPLAEAPMQTLMLVTRLRGALDPTSSRFVEHLRKALGELIAEIT